MCLNLFDLCTIDRTLLSFFSNLVTVIECNYSNCSVLIDCYLKPVAEGQPEEEEGGEASMAHLPPLVEGGRAWLARYLPHAEGWRQDEVASAASAATS